MCLVQWLLGETLKTQTVPFQRDDRLSASQEALRQG